MTMWKVIGCFVMFATLSSCDESQQREFQFKIIPIDVEKNSVKEELFLDRIAVVQRIQLRKPSEDKYIGAVRKIVLHGDNLYVCDSKNLFIYGQDGVCRFIFNREGKSNEEYINIADFVIVDNTLYVIDQRQSKLISYTLKGEFISSFKLSFSPSGIRIDNGSLVIMANNLILDKEEKMKFHRFDIDKREIIDSFFPTDIHKGSYLNILWNNNFTMVNDSLFYYHPFDNMVRYIGKSEASDYLKIDFGKNEPPQEFYQKKYEDVMQFMLSYHDTNYASGIYWAIWNDTKFLFQFIHEKELKVALCDRNKNKTQIFQSIYIDKSRKLEGFYTDSNYLISYISPEDEGMNCDIEVLIATLKD